VRVVVVQQGAVDGVARVNNRRLVSSRVASPLPAQFNTDHAQRRTAQRPVLRHARRVAVTRQRVPHANGGQRITKPRKYTRLAHLAVQQFPVCAAETTASLVSVIDFLARANGVLRRVAFGL